VNSVCEGTFRRNSTPQCSGSNISRRRNQRAAGGKASFINLINLQTVMLIEREMDLMGSESLCVVGFFESSGSANIG
jgi:hypothetical protein